MSKLLLVVEIGSGEKEMGAAEDGAQGPAQAVGCEHVNQAHCQP